MNNYSITRFTAFLLAAVVIPMSILATPITASAQSSKDYLQVLDTIKGINAFYNIDSKIKPELAKLVLVKPDESKKVFTLSQNAGSINARHLSQTGQYAVGLAYKSANGYKVLEIDRFEVEANAGGMNLVSLASEFGVGGDLVAQASNERFKLEDIPATVEPFDSFSVKVKALNANGAVDTSYQGTITFEVSTDANAGLPDDYKFNVSDAGVKTFEDALFLTEVGTHVIKVKDKASSNLMGQFSVRVAETAGGSSNQEDGTLEVISPVAGESSLNQIVFSGNTDPGLEVQILDKGVFLTKTNADAEGKFAVTSAVLNDGDYVFTLKTTKATSDPINVKINTAKSNLSAVNLSATAVAPAQLVEVEVKFKSPVEQVAVVLNGSKTQLVPAEGDKSTFKGSFNAPSELNEYPVNLDVTNAQNIRSEIEDAVILTVSNSGAAATDDIFGGSITFNVPSKIPAIQAIAQDKRVTLTWEPATDNTGIDYYKIFYGTSMDNLDKSVDTNDNSTSWFIPDLQNEVRYYFQIFGVDTEGNRGDQGSAIISAIPGKPDSTTLHGSADGQLMVRGTVESGPEVLLLVVFSLVAGYGLRRLKLI